MVRLILSSHYKKNFVYGAFASCFKKSIVKASSLLQNKIKKADKESSAFLDVTIKVTHYTSFLLKVALPKQSVNYY